LISAFSFLELPQPASVRPLQLGRAPHIAE
jgi:hypothetical protein